MNTSKKLLALFFVAATMTIASCEKDEDIHQDDNQSLVGTTWVAQNRDQYENDDNVMVWYTETITLDFITSSAGTVHYVSQDDGAEPDEDETMSISYTYDGQGEGTITTMVGYETMRFTVEDNHLTLYSPEEWEGFIVFTRQ